MIIESKERKVLKMSRKEIKKIAEGLADNKKDKKEIEKLIKLLFE